MCEDLLLALRISPGKRIEEVEASLFWGILSLLCQRRIRLWMWRKWQREWGIFAAPWPGGDWPVSSSQNQRNLLILLYCFLICRGSSLWFHEWLVTQSTHFCTSNCHVTVSKPFLDIETFKLNDITRPVAFSWRTLK